jgi:hypothetical protein
VALKEEKTPWYRRPQDLIGLFAVIVSVLFSSVSLWIGLSNAASEDLSAKQELLRGTVIELTRTQQELMQLGQTPTSNALALREAGGNLNIKRIHLIETAEGLIDELEQRGEQISPIIYLAVSYQMLTDLRYERAWDYAVKALAIADKSGNTGWTSNALRQLGQLALTSGSPTFEPRKGREYLQRNVALFEGKTDEQSRFSLADGYLFWAIAETVNGDKAAAAPLFEKAAATARTIKVTNASRQVMLYQIDQALKSQELAVDFVNPVGEWEVRYDGDATRTGKAVITYVAQTNSYAVSVLIYDDGVLVETRSGGITVIDPNTVMIDWQSARYQPNAQFSSLAMPSSGSTYLEGAPDGRQWKGTDNVLGEKQSAVTLVKVTQ